MSNEIDFVGGFYPSPSFSKTAREWILSSALYDGIEDEDIRQIQTLLSEKGASPNVLLPEYSITPFHLVVANESVRFAVQATDICLQHGADPNVRSEDGLTPVHLAAMWGCAEVLHVLLASGGDPWLVDCFNMNAFDYALKEGQQKCYDILTRHCNPQFKPSGHSKSPYHLNLKRVILYKNDLQIVYEASSPNSMKSASTQTPPLIQQSEFDSVTEVLNDFAGIESSNSNKQQQSQEKRNLFENKNDNFTNHLKHKQREMGTNGISKIILDSTDSPNHDNLSSKLKDVIVKHRKHSAIFEYSPPEQHVNSSSSGVASWGDLGNREVGSSISELIKKLERTNILRQSLKPSDNLDDKLKNITQRRKPFKYVKPSETTLNEGSVSNYNSCQELNSQNSIDLVLDTTKAESSVLESRPGSVPPESPRSIGYILDNLEETSPQTRGSSLFSDIASDVEVYTSPGQNKNDSPNMTEDDNSFEEKIHYTKYSSSDSLYPYISCEDGSTRERDSHEYFESCKDSLSRTAGAQSTLISHPEIDENETSAVHCLPSEINSVMDTILNSIDDDTPTPVNPKLVTSTPERIACGSHEASFSSAVSSENRRWVEARVLSSSDDDEYMSISEEYEYADLDEGVVLIEKQYLLNDVSVSTVPKKGKKSSAPSSSSGESEVSTVSGSDAAYDTDDLRRALHDHGFIPGPITGTTKRIYLRKLKRCKRNPPLPPKVDQPGEKHQCCHHATSM